jgi:hypothetical protein
MESVPSFEEEMAAREMTLGMARERTSWRGGQGRVDA